MRPDMCVWMCEGVSACARVFKRGRVHVCVVYVCVFCVDV